MGLVFTLFIQPASSSSTRMNSNCILYNPFYIHSPTDWRTLAFTIETAFYTHSNHSLLRTQPPWHVLPSFLLVKIPSQYDVARQVTSLRRYVFEVTLYARPLIPVTRHVRWFLESRYAQRSTYLYRFTCRALSCYNTMDIIIQHSNDLKKLFYSPPGGLGCTAI